MCILLFLYRTDCDSVRCCSRIHGSRHAHIPGRLLLCSAFSSWNVIPIHFFLQGLYVIDVKMNHISNNNSNSIKTQISKQMPMQNENREWHTTNDKEKYPFGYNNKSLNQLNWNCCIYLLCMFHRKQNWKNVPETKFRFCNANHQLNLQGHTVQVQILCRKKPKRLNTWLIYPDRIQSKERDVIRTRNIPISFLSLHTYINI